MTSGAFLLQVKSTPNKLVVLPGLKKLSTSETLIKKMKKTSSVVGGTSNGNGELRHTNQIRSGRMLVIGKDAGDPKGHPR